MDHRQNAPTPSSRPSAVRLLVVAVLLLGSANPILASSLHDQSLGTELELLAPSTITAPTTAYKAIPGGRRVLNDNPFEDAAQALNSQLAGAQAAASEAGNAASRAADSFFSKLTGTNTAAAAGPVASPQQYATSIAKAEPFPAYAPAPAPAFGAALAPAAAVTVLPALATAPAATAPASKATPNATLERLEAVPEYQLGAFMLEMARLINDTQFNGTHVVLGTKLAQQQLKAEASNWLAQQSTHSANSATPSTNGKRRSLKDAPSANPVAKFVQDFENLPQNVTDTFTGFGKHLVTQAANGSYYMEQFKGFLHKLRDPVAVQAGMQLFSNSPCLFSTNLGAIEASATGVSVSPSLINLGATAINVSPQAMSISPALISVGATGVNVAPQGLNIAPALIAVTPGSVAVNPQGGTISPVGISVTAPAGPAMPGDPKPNEGRHLLQESATEQATTAASDGSLPVPLHGLGNWAAVVGKMCQSAAGQSGHDEANFCLSEHFNHTNDRLDSMADRYKDLKDGNLFAALGKDFPKMEIKAPTFYSGSDDVANSNVAALQFGLTGFSFSPCAVAASPAAINIGPTGISISPTVISASATALNVQPQGINISPDLIVVGPYDKTFAGQGLNIAPALITVSPTREAINPVGPLKISDAMVTKTLPALPALPTPGNKS